MAFRNRELVREGEYFVLDRRLHGPHHALPMSVEEGTRTAIAEYVPSLDEAVMVGMSILLVFAMGIAGVGLLSQLWSVALVFSGLAGVLAYSLLGELYERFVKRHGVHLVLSSESGRVTLWFARRDEAERVRRLVMTERV